MSKSCLIQQLLLYGHPGWFCVQLYYKSDDLTIKFCKFVAGFWMMRIFHKFWLKAYEAFTFYVHEYTWNIDFNTFMSESCILLIKWFFESFIHLLSLANSNIFIFNEITSILWR